jgi:hypothetical protein
MVLVYPQRRFIVHKLSDLNVYGQTTVPFEDTRDYLIQWKYNVGALAVTIQEDQPRYISWQAEIDDIAGVELTGDTVEIAVTLLGNNDYVYFNGTAPNAVTLTDQGGGQYLISGIVTFTDWLWVRNNTLIKPPADRNTNWDYSVTITPPVGFSAKNWTVTVSYTGDGEEMSEPLDQEFDPGVPKSVYGHPVVTDVYNTAYSYRVVITSPDAVINTISSSGSGGTATWTSPTYTIQGTKTQVNSHLSTLVVDTDEVVDFTLTYTLTNLISATVTVVTQNWVETVLNTESENLGVARTYISNKINNLMSTDPIQIADGDLTGTYTVAVILNSDIGVFGLSSDTEFPPPEWTAGTLSWEFTGSEAECNTALSQLVFYPNKNTTSATTFTYRQFRGTTIQADATIAISGIANTETIPGEGVYTFTAAGPYTFTPTFEQARYLDIELLAIGGGGAGGGTLWKLGDSVYSDVDSNYTQFHYGSMWDVPSLSSYTVDPVTGDATYVGGTQWIGGGGGAGGCIVATNPDLFYDTVGNVTYNITIGRGGAKPPVTTGNFAYSIQTAPTAGTQTAIQRPGDLTQRISATGGYPGISTSTFGGEGTLRLPPGTTTVTAGHSGVGYINGVIDKTAGSDHSTVTYYASGSNLHPYTLPSVNKWGNLFDYRVEYIRGGINNGNSATSVGQGILSSITGTVVEYAAGGGLAYYGPTLTTPGSGGMAGVYDPGLDFTYRGGAVNQADDVPFGFTDGQDGIIIIKFTQPS